METQGSLLCLQEPATCPYPKPDQSSSCTHLRSILILSQLFPTKTLHALLLPYVLHAQPTSFFSIWSPKYLMNTDH